MRKNGLYTALILSNIVYATKALPHTISDQNKHMRNTHAIQRITQLLNPSQQIHIHKGDSKNIAKDDLLSQIAYVVLSNLDEQEIEKELLEIIKSKNISLHTLQLLLEQIQQAQQNEQTRKLFIAIHNIIAKKRVLHAKQKRQQQKAKRQTNKLLSVFQRT